MFGFVLCVSQTLDAALKLEQTKEKLRLDFASQASDFVLWAKEAADHTANTHFGFTLQQVEAFDIKGEDAKVQEALKTKGALWQATFAEIQKLQVREQQSLAAVVVSFC